MDNKNKKPLAFSRRGEAPPPKPAEYGIGWMPEGARRAGEKLPISDRIYRTPALTVVGISVAAAVIFSTVILVVALICGLTIHSETDPNGEKISFFGIMDKNTAKYGILYLPDGENARISGEKVRFSDGSRYEGGMYGLLFDGEGEFTDPDGNVYKGSFKDGLLEGEGEIVFSDGSVFRGSFLGGKREGYGEFTGADGSSYKGYYAEDVKSGFGEMVYADGGVYKGYFKNGMRHGEGNYRFPSGDIYTGEFKNNIIWGQGSYFFANGRVFTGEFKNGVPIT